MLSLKSCEKPEDLNVVNQEIAAVRSEAQAEIGSSSAMSETELEKKIISLRERADQLNKVVRLCEDLSNRYSLDEVLKNCKKRLNPGEAANLIKSLQKISRFSKILGSAESPIPGLIRPDFSSVKPIFSKVDDKRDFYFCPQRRDYRSNEEILAPLLSPLVAAQTFHPAVLPTRGYRYPVGELFPTIRKLPEFLLGISGMGLSLLTCSHFLPTNPFTVPLPQFALSVGIMAIAARVGLSIGHFIGTSIRAPLIALKRKHQASEDHPEHVLRELVKKGVSAGGNFVDLREPIKTLGSEFEREAKSLSTEAQNLENFLTKLNSKRKLAIVGAEIEKSILHLGPSKDLNEPLVDQVANDTLTARISRLTGEAFKIAENIPPADINDAVNLAQLILDGKRDPYRTSERYPALADWVAKTISNYRNSPLLDSIKIEVKGVLEMVLATRLPNKDGTNIEV